MTNHVPHSPGTYIDITNLKITTPSLSIKNTAYWSIIDLTCRRLHLLRTSGRDSDGDPTHMGVLNSKDLKPASDTGLSHSIIVLMNEPHRNLLVLRELNEQP